MHVSRVTKATLVLTVETLQWLETELVLNATPAAQQAGVAKAIRSEHHICSIESEALAISLPGVGSLSSLNLGCA